MKQKTTEVKTDFVHAVLRNGIFVLLLLIPFHAPITVWLADLGFNYDLVRLWKEFLLFVLVLASLWIVYRSKKFSEWYAGDLLIKLILVFLGITVLSSIVVLAKDSVSPRAVGFGLIIDTRMLIMLMVVMIAIKAKLLLPIPRWVVLPAIVVIGFGLMQMSFLPNNFLEHLGYSEQTIKAYQTVDNNHDFIRAQSTMRGPNPLGAYLIPITALLFVGWLKFKKYRNQFLAAIVASLTVLFGTYSRSAWIGMALAGGLLIVWQLRGKTRKAVLLMASLLVILSGTLVLVLRDNDVVQNIVFHSSEKSSSEISSNEARFNALSEGIGDMAKEPLGGGIGSAGPASVHNLSRGQRQSENFYVQIGQEIGPIGLALYIAIAVVIIRRLWDKRNNLVVQAVLASFIGLIAVNMLSHAWSDDTLAYVFGAVLGYGIVAYKNSTKAEN